jgi:predicted regulator of Ras-like GTPase activity (Roadblock/LC7/MglB family)
MSDRVEHLSAELAREPSSMAFVPLADALRRNGQLAAALRVAERGAARHPQSAAAQDALAHVLADLGDLAHARERWCATLALDPAHTGAMKGLGFLAYREGNWTEAERWFGSVGRLAPGDPGVRVALDRLRAARAAAGNAPSLEAEHAGAVPDERGYGGAAPEPLPFMIDPDGLVLAGGFGDEGGEAENETAGAELAAVAVEVRRALVHLRLGAWESLVVETETRTVALAPASEGGIAVVSSPLDTRAGLVRARLARAVARGRRWLEAL